MAGIQLSTIMSKLMIDKYKRYGFNHWLAPWGSQLIRKVFARRLRIEPPLHILFCLVDHFEPGTGGVDSTQSTERFNYWMENYPELAAGYRDCDGRHPQHTFFFPPHYHNHDYVRRLAALNWIGVGELELHLHHENDTSAGLRSKILNTIHLYSQFGAFLTEGDPVGRAYGFIHGNWALDNSIPKYCGVNDEMTILRKTGCYGDFTFPSLGDAQPRMINSIYRAVDDSQAPKSYDKGIPLEAGVRGDPRNLMLIPGPLGFRRIARFPWIAVEDADVSGEAPGSPDRVREWIGRNIHIRGRPEWIFVKVHTHGAVERHYDALLGDGAKRMYETLCTEFNDGDRYVLHFVTAREMCNIARAAEDGFSGNPGQYRNFEIAPYLSSLIKSNRPYSATAFTANEFEIVAVKPDESARMELKNRGLRLLAGNFKSAALRAGKIFLEGLGPFRLGIEGTRLKGSSGFIEPWAAEKIDGKKVKVFNVLSEKSTFTQVEAVSDNQ